MKIKALVTGHSKGLGKGVCQAFLKQSIPVLGLSRTELEPREGLTQNQLDLASVQVVTRWLADGHLDPFAQGAQLLVLVNNAGRVGPVAPLSRQSPAEVAASVALNVSVPLMLSAAVAQLQAVAEKRVVQVSSGAGRSAYPGWSVYCATKAALDHHARAVQMDSPEGLKLVSLAPGVIDTEMQTEIRQTHERDFPNRKRFEALKKDGLLTNPVEAGQLLVDYALSDRFGEQAVDDLRQR
ncbi:MAG: SDR family NAD(P)-dependent oxidoreductase [Limnobacter sp.]|nr:SDR family NAD(P)-dependent oxidoreductase [Limnobacter sp.]